MTQRRTGQIAIDNRARQGNGRWLLRIAVTCLPALSFVALIAHQPPDFFLNVWEGSRQYQPEARVLKLRFVVFCWGKYQPAAQARTTSGAAFPLLALRAGIEAQLQKARARTATARTSLALRNGMDVPLHATLAGRLAAQEVDAQAALKDLAPPWYAAETDAARSPGFPADRPAVSRERNLIPETQAAKPRAWAGPNMNLDLLSPLATWIVLGLLVALLVFLAWWFLPNRATGRKEEAGSRGPDHALRLEQLPVPLGPGIGDLRAAALQAASEGDFRKAIVYLFSHALVTLDHRGLLELRRGKTNRQYLVELLQKGLPDDRFRGLMLTFERVFFGNHAATEPDFRQCLDAAAQLELLPSAPGNGVGP